MLKTYAIAEGKIVEQTGPAASVFIYVVPDEAERASLFSSFGIDEHTLNSSLDPDELGRVEFEADHIAAIVKVPRRFRYEDKFLLKVSSLGLFLFADRLIIVTAEELFFDGRIFSRLKDIRDLFLKVIFNCVRHFEEHLMVIRKISDELEQEISFAMSNKDLFHMFNIEKSLVYYLNAISSNGKVMEKLRGNAQRVGLSPEAGEFLDDALIENAQCYEQANTYSQVLASMMDARASIISNNLNIRIKRLTIISLCIMFPTLIVSLFSMNVRLPLPQHDTMLSFWVVLTLAVLSVTSILIVVRVRKW